MILSGGSNIGGQIVSKYRDPENNHFNNISLAFALWGAGYSSYITKEINVVLTKTIVDTTIQLPVSGIGSHL